MNSRSAQKLLVASALLLFTICAVSPATYGQDSVSGYVIIVHKDVAIESAGKDELRLLFLGKKSYLVSETISRIVLPEDESTLDAFVRDVTGKSPSTFRNYWKRLVFTGKGSMPVTFDSDKKVIDYVSKTPGAIGIISNLGSTEGAFHPITVKTDN